MQNRLMVAKGEGLGGRMEGLGVWDEPIQTIIYKMDEQDPTALVGRFFITGAA